MVIKGKYKERVFCDECDSYVEDYNPFVPNVCPHCGENINLCFAKIFIARKVTEYKLFDPRTWFGNMGYWESKGGFILTYFTK